MIRRLLTKWHLATEEDYLALLKKNGWTHEELRVLRQKCESLRVKLALCQEPDLADAVVIVASMLAAAMLAAIMVLE